MYPVSDLFKTRTAQPDRLFETKAEIDGVTYLGNEVVDFQVENTVMSSENFTLGTAVSSKLNLSLRTNSTITSGAKITPFIRLGGQGGYTEWLPMGEFYVDSGVFENNVWKFVCYDRLIFAQQPYISGLTYPTTMQAVWNELCTQLGVTSSASVIINPTYMIPAAPTGYTKREVLGFIAAAHVSSVYMDKVGKISFVKFTPAVTSAVSISPSAYFKARQTNPLKTFSKIVVRKMDNGDASEISAGTGDADHTLNIVNPYITQTILNTMHAAFNGFSYIPFTMDWKCFPYLEIGDPITIGIVNGVTWLDLDVSWSDADNTWNDTTWIATTPLSNTMFFSGGLKATMSASSYSEQKSDTVYKGSLTEYAKDIDKRTLKEYKPYYGVSMSRTDGVVVDREDGRSRAIFNGDTLSMQSMNDSNQLVDKLYFDSVKDEFRFLGEVDVTNGNVNVKIAPKNGNPFEISYSGTPIFYVDSLGNGTFSGTIHTAEDAIVGNNVYLGDDSSLDSKYIYFYNSGADLTRAGIDATGEFDIVNWKSITLQSAENVSLLAGGIVDIAADRVDINTFNSGDVNLYSNGNINLMPQTGGAVILDNESYIGSVGDDTWILSKGDGDYYYTKNMSDQQLRFQYFGGHLEVWDGLSYIGRCIFVTE